MQCTVKFEGLVYFPMERLSIVLLLLTTILATCHASSSSSSHGGLPLPINLLRQKSGSGGHHIEGVSCASWRLGVETNNLRNWKTVPAECKDYVGHYMLGHLYRKDSKFVTEEAAKYAESLNLAKDVKYAWVFDIDETTLSNLPYYVQHGFGAELYNSTAFDAWTNTGAGLPLPESVKLYYKLKSLGIKPVFLTGRNENTRNITVKNLKNAGYSGWEKLILRQEPDHGKPAIIYKSEQRAKLEQDGYLIVGNIGDQWSDILGTNIGKRTFKLPDPMYYIA